MRIIWVMRIIRTIRVMITLGLEKSLIKYMTYKYGPGKACTLGDAVPECE
jgi:hypothetical protein